MDNLFDEPLNYLNSAATTATSKLMQVSFRIGTNDECKTFWDPKGDDKYNHEFQLCGVVPGKSVCTVC